MNDREFCCIITIEEEGSIQKAAAKLNKNPSSVRRTLKRVEEELDVPLFRRSPTGLLPTSEGEVYLKAARDILTMYEKLLEKG